MMLDRLSRNEQLRTDIAIRKAAQQQFSDLALALGQSCGRRRMHRRGGWTRRLPRRTATGDLARAPASRPRPSGRSRAVRPDWPGRWHPSPSRVGQHARGAVHLLAVHVVGEHPQPGAPGGRQYARVGTGTRPRGEPARAARESPGSWSRSRRVHPPTSVARTRRSGRRGAPAPRRRDPDDGS